MNNNSIPTLSEKEIPTPLTAVIISVWKPDVMMKIDFKVPTLPEQIQIGKFFDNLDHLITLHQRKYFSLPPPKLHYFITYRF